MRFFGFWVAADLSRFIRGETGSRAENQSDTPAPMNPEQTSSSSHYLVLCCRWRRTPRRVSSMKPEPFLPRHEWDWCWDTVSRDVWNSFSCSVSKFHRYKTLKCFQLEAQQARFFVSHNTNVSYSRTSRAARRSEVWADTRSKRIIWCLRRNYVQKPKWAETEKCRLV